MTTKVLNKLVNICTTLSDGDSGTSNGLTSSEICDLIYPIGSIYSVNDGGIPSNLLGGVWQMLDTTSVTPVLTSDAITITRWKRTE